MSKLRVHDLAGEFGVSSDEVTTLLRQMDIPVRSHLSPLSDDQVARVRARWEREKRARVAAPPATARRRRGTAAAAPAPETKPEPAAAPESSRRRRRVAVEPVAEAPVAEGAPAPESKSSAPAPVPAIAASAAAEAAVADRPKASPPPAPARPVTPPAHITQPTTHSTAERPETRERQRQPTVVPGAPRRGRWPPRPTRPHGQSLCGSRCGHCAPRRDERAWARVRPWRAPGKQGQRGRSEAVSANNQTRLLVDARADPPRWCRRAEDGTSVRR